MGAASAAKAAQEATRYIVCNWDRDFSQKGFASQFFHCEEARKFWAETEKVTGPLYEPGLTRRCECFSIISSDGLTA